MYYSNNGYPNYGYPYQNQNNGNAWGGIFAFILVIFILLVIIGCNSRNNCLGQSCNSCNNMY